MKFWGNDEAVSTVNNSKSSSTLDLLAIPATEAGAFYDQLNKDIDVLRKRVDQKLRDMMSASESDLKKLNSTLEDFRIDETIADGVITKYPEASKTSQVGSAAKSLLSYTRGDYSDAQIGTADSNVTERVANTSKEHTSRHHDLTMTDSCEAQLIGIVKNKPLLEEDDEEEKKDNGRGDQGNERSAFWESHVSESSVESRDDERQDASSENAVRLGNPNSFSPPAEFQREQLENKQAAYAQQMPVQEGNQATKPPRLPYKEVPIIILDAADSQEEDPEYTVEEYGNGGVYMNQGREEQSYVSETDNASKSAGSHFDPINLVTSTSETDMNAPDHIEQERLKVAFHNHEEDFPVKNDQTSPRLGAEEATKISEPSSRSEEETFAKENATLDVPKAQSLTVEKSEESQSQDESPENDESTAATRDIYPDAVSDAAVKTKTQEDGNVQTENSDEKSTASSETKDPPVTQEGEHGTIQTSSSADESDMERKPDPSPRRKVDRAWSDEFLSSDESEIDDRAQRQQEEPAGEHESDKDKDETDSKVDEEKLAMDGTAGKAQESETPEEVSDKHLGAAKRAPMPETEIVSRKSASSFEVCRAKISVDESFEGKISSAQTSSELQNNDRRPSPERPMRPRTRSGKSVQTNRNSLNSESWSFHSLPKERQTRDFSTNTAGEPVVLEGDKGTKSLVASIVIRPSATFSSASHHTSGKSKTKDQASQTEELVVSITPWIGEEDTHEGPPSNIPSNIHVEGIRKSTISRSSCSLEKRGSIGHSHDKHVEKYETSSEKDNDKYFQCEEKKSLGKVPSVIGTTQKGRRSKVPPVEDIFFHTDGDSVSTEELDMDGASHHRERMKRKHHREQRRKSKAEAKSKKTSKRTSGTRSDGSNRDMSLPTKTLASNEGTSLAYQGIVPNDSTQGESTGTPLGLQQPSSTSLISPKAKRETAHISEEQENQQIALFRGEHEHSEQKRSTVVSEKKKTIADELPSHFKPISKRGPTERVENIESRTSPELAENQLILLQQVQNRSLKDPYGDQGRYTGVMVSGKPHGYGIMHYEDGRVYTGEWRSGRWHGNGHAIFANKDSYVGHYNEDRRQGHGRYEWADGRVYDGEFHKDHRQGHGTYTWPDGAVYTGEFNKGLRHGTGRYIFADGSIYDGDWENGRYHGTGECIWADGRKYKGDWRNGQAQGYGVEQRPDGTIRHEGQWRKDRPIRHKRAS